MERRPERSLRGFLISLGPRALAAHAVELRLEAAVVAPLDLGEAGGERGERLIEAAGGEAALGNERKIERSERECAHRVLGGEDLAVDRQGFTHLAEEAPRDLQVLYGVPRPAVFAARLAELEHAVRG